MTWLTFVADHDPHLYLLHYNTAKYSIKHCRLGRQSIAVTMKHKSMFLADKDPLTVRGSSAVAQSDRA